MWAMTSSPFKQLEKDSDLLPVAPEESSWSQAAPGPISQSPKFDQQEASTTGNMGW